MVCKEINRRDYKGSIYNTVWYGGAEDNGHNPRCRSLLERLVRHNKTLLHTGRHFEFAALAVGRLFGRFPHAVDIPGPLAVDALSRKSDEQKGQ